MFRSLHGSLSSRAFSLIELLVVISIIAVLASMLMVGIKMVRTGANISKCGANQRNIGVAMQAYATDNDGFLPYREDNSEWWDRMPDYLENQYQSAYQKNRRDVFHCPFADLEIHSPYTFYTRFSVHFGMNVLLRASCNAAGQWNPQPPSPIRSQPPVPIASVSGNVVLITDNQPWGGTANTYFEGMVGYRATGGPWPVQLLNTGGTVEPIRLHGRTVNLLCVDGHLERVTGTWKDAEMMPRFQTPASTLQ